MGCDASVQIQILNPQSKKPQNLNNNYKIVLPQTPNKQQYTIQHNIQQSVAKSQPPKTLPIKISNFDEKKQNNHGFNQTQKEKEPLISASIPERKMNNEAQQLNWKAWEMNEKQMVQQALHYMIQSAQKDPQFFQTWHNVGSYARHFLKDQKIALKYYEIAINLNPYNYDSLIQMGLSYHDLGQNKQGVFLWQRAIKVREDKKEEIPAWVIRSAAAFYMFQEKGKDYKKAVEILSKYCYFEGFEQSQRNTIRNWLAWAYFHLKDYEKFKPIGKKILTDDNFCTNQDIKKQHVYTYSTVLKEQKNTQEILDFWQERAKKYPNQFKAFYQIGITYKQMLKDNETSLKYFEKAHVIQPKNYDIMYLLAVGYLEIKKVGESIKYFKKYLITLDEEKKDILYWVIGNICAQLLYSEDQSFRNYREAIQIITKYRSNIPQITDQQILQLNCYLAKAYYEEKQFDNFKAEAFKVTENDLERKHSWMTELLFWHLLNNQHKALQAKKIVKYLRDDYYLKYELHSNRVTMKFQLTFKKLFQKIYSWIKPGKVIMALPMNMQYQKFISFECDFKKYNIIKQDSQYNDVIFDFTDGFPEKMHITQVVELYPTWHSGSNLISISNYPNMDHEKELLCDQYYDWNNKDFKKRVDEITVHGKNLYEKILLFQKHMEKNFLHNINNPEFKKEVSPGIFQQDVTKGFTYKHVSETLKTMKGHCIQASHLFINVCRSFGIPARNIGGHFIQRSLKGSGEDHHTVEVYDGVMQKWFYVEPQGGILFGLSSNKHILIGDQKNQKKYQNSDIKPISLEYLRWKEAYQMGNHKTAFTFESNYFYD